ncbi:tyrosine-type recombinase/integrase [Planctomicrobium sp. SH661]|uniref:tyrosine-type recombinase/integrase n=1 Tax=Planctomicrobium sp. SH661 TaxID=3448124 RepID=UPI003F5ADF1E
MKKHLTNPVVAKLPTPASRAAFVHDSQLQGFCISVSPAGRKTFYFYGRVNGRPRRIRIGTFPELTASQARDICKGIIGDVSKGKDVHHDRNAGRRTLGELFDLYLDTHAKLKKRTWERDVKEFNAFHGSWKRKPLAEIRRGMIADRIAEIVASNGKGAGHKARALLSKMFSIAVKHEWVEYNPVTGTDRPTFEPRERYLRPDEVKRFFAAVDDLQRETTRDFIYLAVYTGARRQNLATMRWEELDLDRGLWEIPREKFKGKRSKVIPLIDPALEILRRRFANRATSNPWVFPGGGKVGHIVEPKAAMEKVREASGIQDLRFHDLRRSLGAWMNNAGVNLRLIQTTLGHANIATTAAHYTPAESEVIRAATEAVIGQIMGNGKTGE